MRLLTGADVLKKNFTESVVTIGNFDGVHRGHAELLRQVTTAAAQRGLPSVVVTFEPHPLAVLAPESAPLQITTFAQKVALIGETGVDCLAALTFTPEFSRTTADAFVIDILVGCLGMRHIIIGHDYAFGRDRQGNRESLERLGNAYGFTLEDIDPVGNGEAVFSSSLARRLINNGDMGSANAILGRYHVISGVVVHGREIGHVLGFPTANISTSNELIPPDGVYSVMVSVDGRLVQGACCIGNNPTFAGGGRTIEVFLLDFSGRLYDHEIAICFVERLRGVMKFPDAEALVAAIRHDVATTRAILASVDHGMIKPLLEQETDRSTK